MALFVRAANPIWFLVDLVGQPLNDEYWALFLTNTLPYLPQAPTHDPEGLIPWSGGKVQFQPGGTLPNELYFNPALVYRIEIRHGQTQADPLIYEINNFVPANGNSNSQNNLLRGDNQITNPQFQDINFSSPFTYTQALSGSYVVNVAPGWELRLTGQGTTVLTQLTQSGTDDIQGNPPYALRINNTGWDTAELVQRFNRNGAIFAGGAIAMNATVRAQSTTQELTFIYSPSPPGTPIEILTGTATVGAFTVLKSAIDLPASTNTDVGDDAYVDIIIELEATGIIDITNIQVIGQSIHLPADFDVTVDTPLFKEQTIERQKDFEFHYYANSLIEQPKSSILTAWNFGLNPWQYTTSALTNVATNKYTADQTIIIQQNYVASATGNNIAVGRATFNIRNGGFQITAVGAHNQFAMLQYIDPITMRPYWGKILSSMVNAFITTTHSTSLQFKMRLIYSAGLPGTVSQTNPISSWTEGSDPTFSAGYTEIIPENDPVYILTSEPTSFSFNNIQLPPSTNANMTLGILIYTIGNMNQTATADLMVVNDISLVRNDFAIASPPETFDEVLRKCQYYWEQSYEIGTLPNAATVINSHFAEQTTEGSSPINFIARGFGLEYNTVKRTTAPVVIIYSTSGAGNAVRAFISNNGAGEPGNDVSISNWTISFESDKAAFYLANTAASLATLAQVAALPEGFILYHYTIDARLGV